MLIFNWRYSLIIWIKLKRIFKRGHKLSIKALPRAIKETKLKYYFSIAHNTYYLRVDNFSSKSVFPFAPPSNCPLWSMLDVLAVCFSTIHHGRFTSLAGFKWGTNASKTHTYISIAKWGSHLIALKVYWLLIPDDGQREWCEGISYFNQQIWVTFFLVCICVQEFFNQVTIA